jgi:hypothetical protein
MQLQTKEMIDTGEFPAYSEGIQGESTAIVQGFVNENGHVRRLVKVH